MAEEEAAVDACAALRQKLAIMEPEAKQAWYKAEKVKRAEEEVHQRRMSSEPKAAQESGHTTSKKEQELDGCKCWCG